MIIQVTKRIFALELPFGPLPLPSWAYLIVHPTSSRLLLIDSGGATTPKIIERMMAAGGYRLSDLSDIALTHWHEDHSGGLGRLLDALSQAATVYGGAADLDIYLAQQPLPLHVRSCALVGRGLTFAHAPGRLPRRTDVNWVRLEAHSAALSEWGIEVYPCPGHTVGHTAYVIPGERALLCGDALFLDRGEVYTLMFYHDLAEMDRVGVELLTGLDFDWLLPAHMAPVRVYTSLDERQRQIAKVDGKLKRGTPWLMERVLGMKHVVHLDVQPCSEASPH